MRVAVCVSICNIGGVNLYFIVCHIHNSITFILHSMYVWNWHYMYILELFFAGADID